MTVGDQSELRRPGHRQQPGPRSPVFDNEIQGSSIRPTTRISSAAPKSRSWPTRPWTSTTIPASPTTVPAYLDPVRPGWDRLPLRHHDGRPAHRAAAADFRQRSRRLDILDNNGTFETQVGTSASGVQLGSPSDQLANVDRNGNLQITQFYYGAVQPSSAAAQIAGACSTAALKTTADRSPTPTSSLTATSPGTGPAVTRPAWAPTSRAWAPLTSTSGPAAAATTPTSSSTSVPA